MWRWLGLVLFGVAGGLGAAEKYPITVLSNKVPGGYEIIASNTGAAVVSLWLDLEDGKNTQSDLPMALFRVIPPNSDQITLAKVTPRVTTAAYSFKLRWRWTPGDTEAQHDDNTLYRLPFPDGKRFIIGQAPGGPMLTHSGAESLNAVDIPMPEGTPILAARAGLVVHTEAGYTATSRDPAAATRANAVRILHADGTLATYSHLKHRGVMVSVGQQVKAGEVIGQSGSTGFSSGPHLHFAVFKPVITGDRFTPVSLPFRFYVGNPPLVFTPEYGLVVEAEYTQPGVQPRLSPHVVRPVGNGTR